MEKPKPCTNIIKVSGSSYRFEMYALKSHKKNITTKKKVIATTPRRITKEFKEKEKERRDKEEE